MRRMLLALVFVPLLAACRNEPPQEAAPTDEPAPTSPASDRPPSSPTSSPPVAAVFPAKLEALGTEPFWSLDIDGTTIAYSAVADPDKIVARVTRRETGGVLEMTGDTSYGALATRITREECSDGMSDRVYPYAAKVKLGTRDLQGCARPPGYHSDAP